MLGNFNMRVLLFSSRYACKSHLACHSFYCLTISTQHPHDCFTVYRGTSLLPYERPSIYILHLILQSSYYSIPAFQGSFFIYIAALELRKTSFITQCIFFWIVKMAELVSMEGTLATVREIVPIDIPLRELTCEFKFQKVLDAKSLV
jgi:hypothetical protein